MPLLLQSNQSPLKRDTPTFLQVIEANKGIVFKIANAYCKNAEHRKDLIQEILIQLWLAFGKYDETYRISTWMYRIALNTAISFYRKENRRTSIQQTLPGDLLALHESKQDTDLPGRINQLYQFIKELKEIDRAIIILYLEENSQQEIAAMLGLSATNVATKVARIKEQLKQKFSTVKN